MPPTGASTSGGGTNGRDSSAEAVPTASSAASSDKNASGSIVARLKACKTGSAGAEAPGGSSGSGSSSRRQARDLLQSEAALLEDVALVKLAYVCLCQHDHASALRYSRRVLEKNILLKPSVDEHGKQVEDSKSLWVFQAQ